MSIRKLWITRSLYALTVALAAATEPAEEVRIRSAVYAPPGLTLATQANLVELAVTVRDAKEKPIAGLRKEDFEVFDRGERQTLSVFSASASAPAAGDPQPARYLALFFDDTHTNAAALQNARAAVTQFVNSSSEPGDQFGVFTTSGAETLDFTRDRAALAASLVRLSPHRAGGARAVAVCPELSEFEAYAITRNLDDDIKQAAVLRAIACNCPPPTDSNYGDCVARQPDAVQNAAEMVWAFFRLPSATAVEVLGLVVRHLAHAPGNRVLVMLSPGLLMDRMEKQTSGIVDAALRAHIVIHGIDPSGLSDDRVRGSRQPFLEQLISTVTSGTGGRFFHNNNDIAGAIRGAAATPESSYLLGFSPARAPDDVYHPLKVRVTAAGAERIESRPGYFAAAAEKDSIQQRLDRMAVSRERLNGFPAAVHSAVSAGDNGRIPLRVDVKVDAKALQFPSKEGRRVQQLTFLTILEDASGNYVTGRQAVMDLALTPQKLAEFKREGIKAGLTFYAPKGRYHLREVVREAAQNRISAATFEIEIR